MGWVEMAVGNILTVPELQELTARRTRKGVIEILARENVPFLVAGDGWPRVHQDALLGLNVVSLQTRRDAEPDYDALDNIA